MATLASFFRFGVAPRREAAGPQPAEFTREGPFQLRALPNEDLFVYTKRIDNSRLVRQTNPRDLGECWSTIGAVCALAVVLITTLAPRVAGVMAGYQIQALKQEQQRLLNESRRLEVEEEALLATERLEQVARQRNMVKPGPNQVVHLGEAAEGAVADNRAAKAAE